MFCLINPELVNENSIRTLVIFFGIAFLVVLALEAIQRWYIKYQNRRESKKNQELVDSVTKDGYADINDSPYLAKLRVKSVDHEGVHGTIVPILPKGVSDIRIDKLYPKHDYFFSVQFIVNGRHLYRTWDKRCHINTVPVFIEEIEVEIVG